MATIFLHFAKSIDKHLQLRENTQVGLRDKWVLAKTYGLKESVLGGLSPIRKYGGLRGV